MPPSLEQPQQPPNTGPNIVAMTPSQDASQIHPNTISKDTTTKQNTMLNIMTKKRMQESPKSSTEKKNKKKEMATQKAKIHAPIGKTRLGKKRALLDAKMPSPSSK
eukprot:5226997-Ditylum_brightwellii.AAC.1